MRNKLNDLLFLGVIIVSAIFWYYTLGYVYDTYIKSSLSEPTKVYIPQADSVTSPITPQSQKNKNLVFIQSSNTSGPIMTVCASGVDQSSNLKCNPSRLFVRSPSTQIPLNNIRITNNADPEVVYASKIKTERVK